MSVFFFLTILACHQSDQPSERLTNYIYDSLLMISGKWWQSDTQGNPLHFVLADKSFWQTRQQPATFRFSSDELTSNLITNLAFFGQPKSGCSPCDLILTELTY